MPGQTRANAALGALAILGGVAYLVADLHLPEPTLGGAQGPKLFPAFIGAGIVLSGILLCLERSPPQAEAERVPPSSVPILLGMTAWTVIYDLLFEPLGYLLATFLYVLPLLCVFNRNRWITNLLVATLFTLVAFGVFDKFLGISLPPGLLTF